MCVQGCTLGFEAEAMSFNDVLNKTLLPQSFLKPQSNRTMAGLSGIVTLMDPFT